MDEPLKSAQALFQSGQGLTFLLVGTVSVLIAVLRYRERAWLFGSRRKKRLRELFKDDKWRKASPFDRDGALMDAFGKSVTGAELAFMETRDRPWELLADRLRAGSAARWVTAGGGWEDGRSAFMQRLMSFSTASNVCTAMASAILVVGSAFTLLSWVEGGPFAGVFVGANVLLYFAVFLVASLVQEAAHRVVKLEKYPPAQPIPPRPKRRSGAKTKEELDNGQHDPNSTSPPPATAESTAQ